MTTPLIDLFTRGIVAGESASSMNAETSPISKLTRGSSRHPAVRSAIGPRAHSTISGTSSATVTLTSGQAASAARKVKPIP